MTPSAIAEVRRLLDDMRALATREGVYNGNRAVLDIIRSVEPLLDAAAERDALAAKVERVRALASGMGVPRPGADTDRDSALTRMKLRSAGHRILRALDGAES